MSIHVIFFGPLQELTGTNTITCSYQPDTNRLIAQMENKYPKLIDAAYSIAVNKTIINNNTLLNIDSTVALLPPFSGG